MNEQRKAKTDMLLAASYVLCQLAKGKELKDEWDDLALALEESIITDRNQMATRDKITVIKRVNEFRKRQAALEVIAQVLDDSYPHVTNDPKF